MTTEPLRLRSEFLNTQVIARSSGFRLGVVKELLVDIDRREVVALGLRDNLLSVAGMPRYMYLSEIEKIGDVILVANEDVIEDVNVSTLSRLINCEVVTESEQRLGRVRDFQFSLEDGKVLSLTIASLGLPQIPDQILSTYELPVEDIVSSSPDRIIVFEGAEEHLRQLSVGILERVGISKPPWEREEEDYYLTPTARPENQLGTGIPDRPRVTARPVETQEPAYQEAWTEEDGWEPEPEPLVQRREPQRYEQRAVLEEDNWSDVPEASYEATEPAPGYRDHDVEADLWDDGPYEPKPVELPEKAKTPEYEEETNY
ncbi:PRC-barrel domain protein [Rubidibacter lacunae KORDI 51-2]|uniref:PRC-barrel domain protein n=1 Tax=Rubidibacter lacunae KORDI 51-2 TaxID=582515 RepID=U5DHQ5_9CHRO|nr:PRC-barrel domain-containing protein [Rubidibacter lacunae]ERN41171.1 PRC-barrel domain protein [Rubidibacter lacunae KORDI 51-2]